MKENNLPDWAFVNIKNSEHAAVLAAAAYAGNSSIGKRLLELADRMGAALKEARAQRAAPTYFGPDRRAGVRGTSNRGRI